MNFLERLNEVQTEVLPYFKRLAKDPLLADEILWFVSGQAWLHWRVKSVHELMRLMTTAGRNYYLNHRQKERNQKHLAIVATQLKPISQTQTEIDRHEKLHQFVARLPANWRGVIFRVYFGNQTNAEVAEAMGQSLSAIKNWRRRGLLQLRGMLEDVSNN